MTLYVPTMLLGRTDSQGAPPLGSAPRWTTASCPSKAGLMASRSARSATSEGTPSTATLSRTLSSYFEPRSRRTIPPMQPAPPVTSTFFFAIAPLINSDFRSDGCDCTPAGTPASCNRHQLRQWTNLKPTRSAPLPRGPAGPLQPAKRPGLLSQVNSRRDQNFRPKRSNSRNPPVTVQSSWSTERAGLKPAPTALGMTSAEVRQRSPQGQEVNLLPQL